MLTTANIIGFVVTNKRYFFIGAAVLIGLVLVIGFLRSCGAGPTPKLNEVEIQRGEQAVKEQNRKELEEILINAEVRERQIDANLANGRAETVNAIDEARRKYRQMTNEDLSAEFEKRK
ncbi:MAG: hypothetical protein KF855_03720 [Acidobacteria bacterium]|nr:hypothetical protein [Acidobacteriota bacterium]